MKPSFLEANDRELDFLRRAGAQRFANTSLFQLLLDNSPPREVWFKLGYSWSLGFFIAGAWTSSLTISASLG